MKKNESQIMQLAESEVIFHTWPIFVELQLVDGIYHVNLAKNKIERIVITVPVILPLGTDLSIKDVNFFVPANNIYCITHKRDLVFPLDQCDTDKNEMVTGLQCTFNLHLKEDGLVMITTGNQSLSCFLTKINYQAIQKRQKGVL